MTSRADNTNTGKAVDTRQQEPDAEAAYLPDFCSSNTVFFVVLVAELAAIMMTLARQVSWSDFFIDLAKTSLLLIWMSLAITAMLCALRDRLNSYSVARASLLTLVTVNVVIIAVSEAVFWIGALYSTPVNTTLNAWFPQHHWYFLSSNVVVGTILAGLVLRYFYVSQQWKRNVESEARTRIHALQARIRPHFLFNSMNTIAELTRTNPQAAEAAIENLSDLFRASLSDSQKLIPLAQEIEITRVYEDMEKQRLGDRLTVDWQLEALPPPARIPSLTLQPLLENAINHGIEPLPEPGIVEIKGRQKGNMVYLSVRNRLPIKKYQSSGGNQIALDNIRERLELAFGAQASLSRAIDQTHYEVSIAFPVKE